VVNESSVWNSLKEWVGYGLVIAFLWFVWPPLVLLGSGLLIVIDANARKRGRMVSALAAAWTAGRTAFAKRDEPTDLRSAA
jgi:hypothetical protein